MAINRLTKMFPPRQNVVEQPRAHLVADSYETAHQHGGDRVHVLCVFLDNQVSVQAPALEGPVVILLEGTSHNRYG